MGKEENSGASKEEREVGREELSTDDAKGRESRAMISLRKRKK